MAPTPFAAAMIAAPTTDNATATRKSGAGRWWKNSHAAAVTTIGVTLASTEALLTDV